MNGDINLAKKLIDTTKEAGADVVKFQTLEAEEVITQSAKKAVYQKKTAVQRNPNLRCLRGWSYGKGF
ncbi:N-acetylneuraminate synthase family protein [Chloroflexota bacterium]